MQGLGPSVSLGGVAGGMVYTAVTLLCQRRQGQLPLKYNTLMISQVDVFY